MNDDEGLDDVDAGDVELVALTGDPNPTALGQAAPQNKSSELALVRARLFARDNVGYLATYFTVGLVYGGLPATLYGVFNGVLNVQGYEYQGVKALVTLPWSFKVFLGAMNDVAPLAGGYRRRPYMSIGWALCALTLVLLAFLGLPEPYFCRDHDGSYIVECTEKTAYHSIACPNERSDGTQAEPCNARAPDSAGTISSLMALAAFGYMVADVAADGLTVTLAQTETQTIRGYTQTTAYLTRSVGMAISVAIVGLCMNGKIYNGTFAWSLSFSSICMIFAFAAVAMVPLTWKFVREDPVPQSQRAKLGPYAKSAWQLMNARHFAAVCAFSILYSTVRSIESPATVLVTRYWAGVHNLQQKTASLAGQLMFALGLALVRRYLLNHSWRYLLIVTTVILIFVDAIFVFCTVFDVIRNQYFFLCDVLLELPTAVEFLVTTYYVVEAADAHNGGMVYGLLTTAHNIGLSLAPVIANQIFGLFPMNLSDSANFIEDSTRFRKVVAGSYIIAYLFSVIAWAILPLLPNQKDQAQARKRTWGTSRSLAIAVTASLVLCFIYSVSTLLLTVFPATACLKFVGGPGC